MPAVVIRKAAGDDATWAAGLMSASDPWVTLGRGFDACLAACASPQDVLEIAESGGERCGLVLMRPAGVAGAPYIVSIAVRGVRSQGVGRGPPRPRRAHYRGARATCSCASPLSIRAPGASMSATGSKRWHAQAFLIEDADEV